MLLYILNIFLADLPKTFQEDEELLKLDENETLCSIIWADDLLLLSQSEKGLNRLLSILNTYSKENLIEINVDKTKCMIFNKTGRHLRKTFLLGNNKIDTMKEYKYLGFLITPSLNLTTALGNLKDRASRALALIKTRLGEHFRKDIITTLYLFDTLVKPILLYASDYWGCLKLPRNNPIENFHMKFCKDVLGVQRQTTNVGVLLELGRIPLIIYAKKNCIKNWERIAVQERANKITKISNDWVTKNNIGWAYSIKEYFSHIGLMTYFLTKSTRKVASSVVLNREKDIFYQLAFYDIQQNSSKLRTYAKIKTTIGIEGYLSKIHNTIDRISMSKFRLSNHRLMIEKGRHNNVEIQNRKCPFCLTHIEDEIHFLVNCPTYSPIRENLMEKVDVRNKGLCTDELLFKFLMENEEILSLTANFITRCNNVRDFLLTKHRNET